MIRKLKKRLTERRMARMFDAGYKHGAAWLLQGRPAHELLAQKSPPSRFNEFDRGINVAFSDFVRLVKELP